MTRQHLLAAGVALGLRRSTAERELDSLLRRLPPATDELIGSVMSEARALVPASPNPPVAAAFLAAEERLLAAIRHVVLPDMLERLSP